MNSIPKAGRSQSTPLVRRVGDQLYVHLWTEGGQEVWASFCAACGSAPFTYWKPVGRQGFLPVRRCPSHSNAGAKVREVVRVTDDATTLEILLAAKSQLDKLGIGPTERLERFAAVASELLRERLDAGPLPAPERNHGSGWFKRFRGGFFRACDICGGVAVTINDPREQSGWPLVRCRQCFKSDARIPLPFAKVLTARVKRSIYKAALRAMQDERQLRGDPPPGEEHETFMRYARLARKVLLVKFNEEHGS